MGRPSGWSSPSPATARSTPRSRSTRCPIAPATTGTCASTACPRSSATATGSTAPRTTAIATTPDHPARPVLAGPLVRPAVGDRRRTCPRRSLMTESMIDRARAGQSRARRWKTRSSTSCTCAATRSTPARACAIPGTYPRPGREDRVPQGAGDHRRRAAAGRRVRRERLSVRQSADRREAAEFLGLQPDRLLRAQGGLRQQPRAIGALARILRDGRCVPRGGIEVYLDVVFNHTAEGGDDGPTYSFRGIDNTLYYMLDEQGRYLNFSGCGNTFSSDHPVVRNYLLDCLRNWVAEGGVDGFRFDLASVLGRDRHGNVLVEPPVDQADLRGLAASRHQADRRALGRRRALPGRHVPRRGPLVRLERPLSRRRPAVLARRPGHDLGAGHAALRQRRPLPRAAGRSIRSTSSAATTASRSTTWSPTTTSTTRPTAKGTATAATPTGAGTAASRARPTTRRCCAIRSRQVRNLMATLMVSQGVPMILGGDEFLRTQHGNNNAWCQDNPIELGRLVAAGAERRLPPVRRDDDRLAEGPSGPAAPHVLHGRARRPAAGNPLARRRAARARLRPRQPFARLRPRRPALRPAQPDRSRHLRGDERLRTSRSTSGSPPRPRAAPGAGSSTRPSLHPRISSRKTTGPRASPVRWRHRIPCPGGTPMIIRRLPEAGRATDGSRALPETALRSDAGDMRAGKLPDKDSNLEPSG